jgi:hypothetical protein
VKKGASLSEFANLQILAFISPLPVAKRLPVGLGATEITFGGQGQQCSKSCVKRGLRLDIPEFLCP